MKFQIDSIDGHFMICGNKNLNHQDTEMLQGDLFIREAGQPDCFGLLFTDLERREALTRKRRENAIKHAHLIAAAPELLEACQEIITSWENASFEFYQPHGWRFDAAVGMAREAIKKATE